MAHSKLTPKQTEALNDWGTSEPALKQGILIGEDQLLLGDLFNEALISSSEELGDINDVILTNLQVNDIIKYDGNNWVNAIDVGAAGGSNTEMQFNSSGVLNGVTGVTTNGSNLKFTDFTKVNFGTGDDFQISHTGGGALVENFTGSFDIFNDASGDLILRNSATANDIIARIGTDTNTTSFNIRNASDVQIFTVDGNGEVQFGGLTGMTVTSNGTRLNLKDNDTLRIGTGSDLLIFHDGTNSVLLNQTVGFLLQQNAAADITIRNTSTTSDIVNRLGTTTSATNFNVVDSALTKLFNVSGDGLVTAGSSFTVDSSTGNTTINAELLVGTGVSSGDSEIHIHKGSAGSVVAGGEAVLTLENNGNVAMQFLTPNVNHQHIIFGRPANTFHGSIFYNNSTTLDGFQFKTGGDVSAMAIDSTQAVGIGTNDPDSNAILELLSITRGFLPTRWTTTEQTTNVSGFGSGQAGMFWFNTTTSKFTGWDGTSLITITSA